MAGGGCRWRLEGVAGGGGWLEAWWLEGVVAGGWVEGVGGWQGGGVGGWVGGWVAGGWVHGSVRYGKPPARFGAVR